MKAVANTFHEPPYLSVKEVAKLTGWKEHLVRKYVRKGLFKNSLLPNAAGNGQHKKFDPVKVLDEIKSIKSKLGTKSRRKRK
jgi:DNA-binding transcriptional MerR regulator